MLSMSDETPFIPILHSINSDNFSSSVSDISCLSRRPYANLDISIINLDRKLGFFSKLDIADEISQANETAFSSSNLVEFLAAAQYFGHLYEESMNLDVLNEAIYCYTTAEEESRGVDPVCRRVALQGLSICYLLRYESQKDRSDFDKAINICCNRPGHNGPPIAILGSIFGSHIVSHNRAIGMTWKSLLSTIATALSHPFPRRTDYLMLCEDLILGYQTYPGFRSLLLARAREAKSAILSHDPDKMHQLLILNLLCVLLREHFRQDKSSQTLEEAVAVDQEMFEILWPIWESGAFSERWILRTDSDRLGRALELLTSLQGECLDFKKTPQYMDCWFQGTLRDTDFIRLLLLRLKIQPREIPKVLEVLSRIHLTQRLGATLCNPEPGPKEPFVIIVSSSRKSDEILAFSSGHERIKEVFPFVRNLTDVRNVLSLPDPLSYALKADAVWVPSTMHLLQLAKELDDLASQHRKAGLKLLRTLARRHGLLPPSIVLKDVKCHDQNAVRGGGFADIWKGEAFGRPVCLKVLRMFIESDDRTRDHVISEFCHEALLWRQLNDPNVLPFWGVNNDLFAPGFCLISPWMNNGDIVTFLRNNPDHDRLDAIYQISKGLAYLHSLTPPIVHGDIRGANILVADDLQCCLADFGLALAAESQVLASTTGGSQGSVRWMAPELMERGIIRHEGGLRDKKPRDIYAFGCTIYEILTGKVPFSEQSVEITVILGVIKGLRPARPVDAWCPESVWDLVENCWAQDPQQRPRANNVRNFLDRLCLLRKRGIDGYLTLGFDADTSAPICIDLSDDDECDLQDSDDDECDSQNSDVDKNDWRNYNGWTVLSPRRDSFV